MKLIGFLRGAYRRLQAKHIDKAFARLSEPGIKEVRWSPLLHLLRCGKNGAAASQVEFLEIFARGGIDPAKPTILIVTHEASRTGAPILSLNLAQTLADRYTVVTLLLNSGPLVEAFKSSSAAVVSTTVLHNNHFYFRRVLANIRKRYDLNFALVNSIESRAVLPILASLQVPTVGLIHEFAAYTRPREAFIEGLFWATETVFSTRITLENAVEQLPGIAAMPVEVLPQGRCRVPKQQRSYGEVEQERRRLMDILRPGGKHNSDVVVLGVGSVHYRKGVDLFIECVSRVVRSPIGSRCRFVWIGQGYNPDEDAGYSAYLADQIRRSGVENQLAITGETDEIDYAYQTANIMVLSSRLDPLPNVAIDAMVHGLPVLCFDKTTGIADFFIRNGLAEFCVADYLDTCDLAQKLLPLIESESLRRSVGERCRSAALKTFDMKKYVGQLERLALSGRERIDQERADVQTIIASGRFCNWYSLPCNAQNLSEADVIVRYVRSWKTTIGRRKPHPGFHPGIYAARHNLSKKQADPFAHYLRHGQPHGSWNYRVVAPAKSDERTTFDGGRVALHLHAYYPELLPEIIRRLEHNRIRPDLLVSVKDELSRELAADALKEYAGTVVDVGILPNRGRDIAPLLTAFGRQLVEDYDFIGHVHTKRSLAIKDRQIIADWYDFLLENLLGGRSGGPIADTILAAMSADAKIGIVFPDDPNCIGWTRNRSFAEALAPRLGLSELPEYFNFPVGTMFWIRSSVLARFVALGLDWDDYPAEPAPYDGTVLHAVERLFGLVPGVMGMEYAVTAVPGVTR